MAAGEYGVRARVALVGEEHGDARADVLPLDQGCLAHANGADVRDRVQPPRLSQFGFLGRALSQRGHGGLGAVQRRLQAKYRSAIATLVEVRSWPRDTSHFLQPLFVGRVDAVKPTDTTPCRRNRPTTSKRVT